MKTYRVVITDAAFAIVREQVRYIAVEGQAPLNAERWLDRVIAAASSLDQMPRRCPTAIENNFRPYEIRAMHIDEYMLLFTVNDESSTVTVIGARHGRQLPRPEELPGDVPKAEPETE